MPELTPWAVPAAPRRREHDRVPGAMAGSLLFAQPEHRPQVERVLAFLEPPGPVGLEIGFDHAMCILDRARSYPDVRQLGLEIRKRRVAAAAPHAPPNCLLWAADARGVLATVIPAGRLDHVYILFPTPADNPRHLLLTPEFVEDLRRGMAPRGRLRISTDVPAYAAHIRSLFHDWRDTSAPPLGTELSRRERVCRRDAIPVHTLDLEPP